MNLYEFITAELQLAVGTFFDYKPLAALNSINVHVTKWIYFSCN